MKASRTSRRRVSSCGMQRVGPCATRVPSRKSRSSRRGRGWRVRSTGGATRPHRACSMPGAGASSPAASPGCSRSCSRSSRRTRCRLRSPRSSCATTTSRWCPPITRPRASTHRRRSASRSTRCRSSTASRSTSSSRRCSIGSIRSPARRRRCPSKRAAISAPSAGASSAASAARGHCGVDLDGPEGRPVVAVADGVVVRVERHELGLDGKSGRYVRIEHDDGTLTAYMHLDEIADGLELGDHVDGGQYIGTLGATAVYAVGAAPALLARDPERARPPRRQHEHALRRSGAVPGARLRVPAARTPPRHQARAIVRPCRPAKTGCVASARCTAVRSRSCTRRRGGGRPRSRRRGALAAVGSSRSACRSGSSRIVVAALAKACGFPIAIAALARARDADRGVGRPDRARAGRAHRSQRQSRSPTRAGDPRARVRHARARRGDRCRSRPRTGSACSSRPR